MAVVVGAGASVIVSVTAGVVVRVSAATVTAVVVGTGCGDGVVDSAKGLHPERLNSMVRQAITVTFLIMDNLRATF
jgi:hypothetical protein